MADPTWPAATLIAAAQRGDVDSLTALVSGSHPHVRRFARTLCASPEDAEDAAQEALIILYRKIGMLRASGALASWMFRIVRNECLRRARSAIPRGPAPVPDDGRAVMSAEDEVVLRLEAARVARAVAALPEDQRSVLVMRDIQGLSGRLTADALGIGTAAMKSRLHRARAAVQLALHPVPEGGGDGADR
ncbi:RNA polymerase sigma factor [Streptomyces sp. NBC_01351]|uniref:RNA polymerase sigma factor n=1 Tax=Streptomyces sp. NBC_01351 TaxID=2903833 RepID=UPI002E371F54|nr:RNA polymerase sigma factor [Streptomyces sp. NBC_01351]